MGHSSRTVWFSWSVLIPWSSEQSLGYQVHKVLQYGRLRTAGWCQFYLLQGTFFPWRHPGSAITLWLPPAFFFGTEVALLSFCQFPTNQACEELVPLQFSDHPPYTWAWRDDPASWEHPRLPHSSNPITLSTWSQVALNLEKKESHNLQPTNYTKIYLATELFLRSCIGIPWKNWQRSIKKGKICILM
jgi:hypothetical protein